MDSSPDQQPMERTENLHSPPPDKLPYCKPILQELGDLRTLTLGGTIAFPNDFSGDMNYTPFPP